MATPASASRRGAQIEQARGQVDPDHLTDLRRDDLRCVGGAARHVEHEHAGIQRLQLLDHASGPPHERRVGPGEQADLAGRRMLRTRSSWSVMGPLLQSAAWASPRHRPTMWPYRSRCEQGHRCAPAAGPRTATTSCRCGTPTSCTSCSTRSRAWPRCETAGSHHLLPPQQAAWIPAGLAHQTTLRQVRSVAVFFEPSMVTDRDDRVRVLAAGAPVREMIVYADALARSTAR